MFPFSGTISPADMKSALNFFPKDKLSNIIVKNFKNEMIMLHTSKFYITCF
jgi:hypothetical protein